MDKNTTSMFGFSLDDLSQYSTALAGQGVGSAGGIGSIESSITNNLFGLNHRQTPSALPHNRDHYGLTFFTRPQLNLQKPNLRNDSRFFPLLTNNTKSYQAQYRNLLDPRMAFGWPGEEAKDAMFTDPYQVFIPMLTNQLVSMSGWRDIVLNSFTSKEGVYRDSWSIGDGTTRDYSTYDLSCTFRNTLGDPITELMFYWVNYISNVFEGMFNPYPDFLLMNEIDYNTRIYRLVLDKTKTYVQRIFATGAAYPTNVPIGALGDFAVDKPYNDVNAEITIQFKCTGMIYNDEILFHNFNSSVGIFNKAFRGLKPTESGSLPESTGLIKIHNQLLPLFNHRGYPYINTRTYELEWYIPQELMNAKLAKYFSVKDMLMNTPTLSDSPDLISADQNSNFLEA